MENKLADLERKEAQLVNVIENNHLKVSEIENLKSLGFGLREVRFLHRTIKEIFEANGLNQQMSGHEEIFDRR